MLANNDNGKVGQRTGLPQERYQFHFPDSQFMDRADHQINVVDFLNNKAPDLKEIFKDEFAKGLVNNVGNKLVIENFRGSAGKFIGLYGFEDLFDSLPDTVEHITIKGEKGGQSFDIPESLGRFKNLKSLSLQDCIKSLPESIGNCSNLMILTLPDNKELKSLPVAIGTLNELSFVNVKGSNPNLIIPPGLSEKLDDEGDGFYVVK
jgi:Leucine-rich repeat (LRR) protein